MHPQKTYIGRWRKGLAFLGLRIEESQTGRDAAPPRDSPTRLPAKLNGPVTNGVRLPDFAIRVAGPPSLRLRLGPSAPAWGKFVAHCHRLYEQGAEDAALAEYVRRWQGWLKSGLADIPRPVAR